MSRLSTVMDISAEVNQIEQEINALKSSQPIDGSQINYILNETANQSDFSSNDEIIRRTIKFTSQNMDYALSDLFVIVSLDSSNNKLNTWQLEYPFLLNTTQAFQQDGSGVSKRDSLFRIEIQNYPRRNYFLKVYVLSTDKGVIQVL